MAKVPQYGWVGSLTNCCPFQIGNVCLAWVLSICELCIWAVYKNTTTKHMFYFLDADKQTLLNYIYFLSFFLFNKKFQ